MTSLAIFLKDYGNIVIGSDNNNYYFTVNKLVNNNIYYLPFGQNQLLEDFTYIISNAYDKNNIEVNKIIDNNYKYYYYHDFIGKVLHKKIIAVSGTHGKTTTTSFIAQLLEYKTSYIIGDGEGKGYKKNDLLVLEACEYKNHFLSYNPYISVITNIELDHPDFFSDINQVIESFSKFICQSEVVIANGDDNYLKNITEKNVIKVGKTEGNDIKFEIIEETNLGYIVKLFYKDDIYILSIPFLGEHFVYDYVLAYVTCLYLGIKPNTNNITLPSRRMDTYEYGNTIIIDDYAHHPTEIKALYQSLKKSFPNYKKNVIFQPHTYTRTLKLSNDFISSLSLFDEVYIENVFTSEREKENIHLQNQIDEIFKPFSKFNMNILNKINKENKEVWVFLGAGEVNKYIDKITKSVN